MTRSDDEWLESESQNFGEPRVKEPRVDAAGDVVVDGNRRQDRHAQDVLDIAIVEHAMRGTHDDETVDLFESRVDHGSSKSEVTGLNHHDVEIAVFVQRIRKSHQAGVDHGVVSRCVVREG